MSQLKKKKSKKHLWWPWKVLICWHKSVMMPSNIPNTIWSVSHLWCAWLFIPEYTQRASQDALFLWGSRASYMPYHQKDVTHTTRYHGEEPLHALLTLHSFPLFFYLEYKDTILFYMWKALSTFTLVSLLFTPFFVQSSKDLLSDQLVLTFDFLLASNLVSHWPKPWFCFLNRQASLGKVIDRSISTDAFPHRKTTTWIGKTS